jgi:CheY-like chemotaxis protein
MMMPGMDGPALIRAVRQQAPRLPIFGMTGIGERADIKGLEALNVAPLLTKPFNSTGLLGLLRQALASHLATGADAP